tara:strand:- start:4625 stop:6118 length:1494 start_codon:yes stop_codon:yes gene_type:complete
MQSVMLAIYSLSNDLAIDEVVKLESLAYATAGIGFTLFLVAQGVNIFTRTDIKKALIIPLVLAPVVFVLGQLISLSAVESIPSMLSNKQKGIALKSSFALKLSETKGIAPFFFERDSVEGMNSSSLASRYYSNLSEREAKFQLLAGISFITELSAIYKYGQPSSKELRIYRSKYMIDYLDSSIYRDFDRRAFSTIVNMNHVEPNPAIDVLSDIELFMASEQLNFDQKMLMSKLYLKKKAQDYSSLFINVESNNIDLDYHFKQNEKTSLGELSHLLINGFDVSPLVANNVAKNGLGEVLNYGMTYKMFEPLIPKNFQLSPLSIGLSEQQFLNHEFVAQIVSINAPIMMFKGREFVPIYKLANFDYADQLHNGISSGLDNNVINKVAKMNAAISIEMFNGGVYWDGVWANKVLVKKLIPSVSMPIIIAISILLILLNLYSVMILLSVNPKAIKASVVVVALSFFLVDLTSLSEAYSQNVMEHAGGIIDTLSSIGIKPVK